MAMLKNIVAMLGNILTPLGGKMTIMGIFFASGFGVV